MASMKLITKITTLLAEKGWSAATLAERTGIPPQRISEWGNLPNRKPSLAQALTLAHVLGVPMEYLADDGMEAPPIRPDHERRILEIAADIGPRLAIRRLYGMPDDGPMPNTVPQRGYPEPYRPGSTDPPSSVPVSPSPKKRGNSA